MRANEFIAEAVNDNYLYHSTTPSGLKGMIRSGTIQPSTAKLAHGGGGGGIGDHGAVSLSRDKHYFPFDETDIQIVLNRSALEKNFRIKPHNFAGRYEAEERIDKPIPFNSRYVKGIVFRNEPPNSAMSSELKQLGIDVQEYRPLPPSDVYSKVDFTVDPKEYGDEKLDWKITSIDDPKGVWKRARNITADQAVAWFNDYDKKMRSPNSNTGQYRLIVDEAVIAERRKRKKKVKSAAYGPGPFGMYGTAGGYSGAGGVGSSGAVGEGWKDTLAGLGIAGAVGLGSVGAMNARQALTVPDNKPAISQTAQDSGQRVSGKVVDAPKKKEIVNVSGTAEEATLKKAAKAAGIDGIELAAFLAQAAHETMNFRRMVEAGSAKTFNRYDPRFAPNRAKILGNTKAGDGERYKGRGYIQLTGRYNYRRAGQALDLPLEQQPELAADPAVAAKIAIWYWKRRVQPRVSDFEDVSAVTRPINAGLNGLEDREEKFQSYMVAFQ
jgi:predicted chitinase